MNRIYRLVWSHRQDKFVVTHEKARACGRATSSVAGGVASLLLGGLITGLSGTASAQTAASTLPNGGQVTAGSASISAAGNNLTIQQASQRAAINWQSFSIGQDATVNFQQPNAAAVILNRVVGTEQSVIDGALKANGQVFLLNANGVLFGKGARVDVGGLVASTLNLSDADFMAGKSTFTGNGNQGRVINLGTLTAADGGYIALLGKQVVNEGIIAAKLGTAALAAGDKISLNFGGNSLVGVSIDQGTLDALVDNKNAIIADGGLVVLTAKGLDQVMATVVNNSGEVRARTIDTKEGKIYLLGGMDNNRIEVGGTLDASAPNGSNGGFVETSAANVQIKDGTLVTTTAAQGKTGMWLIDPTDFTIAAGSGAQTSSSIGATTLQNNLGNGSITIANDTSTGTDQGNININSAISWSANSLILNATKDININANVTVTGTGGLELNHGAAGTVNVGMLTPDVNNGMGFVGRVDFNGSGGLKIGNQTVTVIRDATALQNMQNNLSGKYALGTDITLTNSANNFTPIGNPYTPVRSFPSGTGDPFTGLFDGLGNTISNLRPTPVVGGAEKTAALFGYVAGAALRNVGFDAANVVGGVSTNIDGANSRSYTAVLAGFYVHNSSVSYPISTGAPGKISNIWAAGSVSGSDAYVGGLIGFVYSSATTGQSTDLGIKIDNVRTNIAVSFTNPTANTDPRSHIGGLIGTMRAVAGNSSVTVSRSYSLGNVTYSGTGAHTIYGVGGLVGSVTGNTSVVFNNVFAAGNVVAGSANAASWGYGGLIGFAEMDSAGNLSITDSYATGNVAGKSYVGGLVGTGNNVTLNRVYASGTVTGNAGQIGGLISGYGNFGGNPSGITVSNSFYNSTNSVGFATGSYSAAQIKGMTAAELKVKANFTTATAANGNVNPNWDYTPATGTWGMKTSASINSGYPYLCVFWSGCGSKITIAIADSSKVYGDTNPTLPTYTLTGSLQSGDSLSSIAWGSAASTTMDAGTYAYSTTSLLAPSFTFGAGNSIGDYIIDWGTTGLTVNPKTLTASIINTPTRAYNGGTIATLASGNFSLAGLVGSEQFTIAQTAGTFNSKNVDASTVSANLASGDFTAVGGAKASNYTLPTTATGAARITAKTVTLSASKTYDGSTDLATKVTVTTGVTGEALTYTGATANSADVATPSKYISTIALANGTGGTASNYQLPTLDVANAPVNINAKALTITGSSAAGKSYDSNTTADITLGTLSGFVGSETVTAAASGTFDNKNAGSRTATAVYTLGNGNGGLASNYSLASDTFSNITVAKKVLTVSGTTTVGRAYDGTTNAAIAVGTLGGFVGSETVTATASGTFDSKNAGSRTATAVYTLFNGNNGGLTGNYSLANTPGLGATITPKSLTIAGLTSSDKTYNGNNAATVIGTASLLSNEGAGVGSTMDGKPYSGDTINLTGTPVGSFTDANVAYASGTPSGKTVTFTGVGVDNSNYTVTNPTTTNKITPLAVTVGTVTTGSVGASRPYDATTNVDSNLLRIANIVGTDSVGLTGIATLDSKNVGDRAVSSLGTIALNGAAASNYTLSGWAASGDKVRVTPKALTISGLSSVDKVYDGTTTATVSGTAALQGFETAGTGASNDGKAYSGDGVRVAGAAGGTFNSKDVSSASKVTFSGLSLDGTDAGNYALTQHADASQIVTPKALAVSGITAGNKVYDGNTGAGVSVGAAQYGGLVSGDSFNVAATGTFSDKNKGTGKTVALASTYSGSDVSNYTITDQASTTADITPLELAMNGTKAVDRVFNGGTQVDLVLGTLSGLVVNETLIVSAVGVSEDAAPGTQKVRTTYTLSDGSNGGLANNYALKDAFDLNVNIKPSTVLENTIGNAVNLAAAQLTPPVSPVVVSPSGFVAGSPGNVTANVVMAPASVTATFGNGANLALLSTPRANEATLAVTISEARAMLAGANGGVAQDVRVPVSRNSLADIVNGGVNLPMGLEQQLFVVQP